LVFAAGKRVEVFQDPIFHFLRRLFGESDGKDMSEIVCAELQGKREICFCQRSRLS
jgi:hypothetical protein